MYHTMKITICFLLVSQCLGALVQKKFEKCDVWAQEGECVANPNFMYSSCVSSCVEFARNTEDMCEEWANEGECSANPSYIQLHCPESCHFSLAWSPWARQGAGIDRFVPVDLNFEEAIEHCPIPQDILGAASLLKRRITLYLSGAAKAAVVSTEVYILFFTIESYDLFHRDFPQTRLLNYSACSA